LRTDTTLHADGDQLDQLLINLVRNAADAVQTAGAYRGRVSRKRGLSDATW
jgi:nitrogen-specific signal transduction histidine kinase